jgi:hypothetical protein
MNDSIETEPVFQGIFVIWRSYGRPGPREEANPCPRKGATLAIDPVSRSSQERNGVK